MNKPTQPEALKAVRTIIEYIGEDPDQDDLLETPDRYLRAWAEDWGTGYKTGGNHLIKLFRDPKRNYDEVVIVRGILMFSHCRHHLAPFYGTADIAYLPDPERGILGLSKFARVVNHFARRLQVQEHLTEEIASFIEEKVSDRAVAVLIRATHTCMCSRGAHAFGAQTITSAFRPKGVVIEKPGFRDEFLKLVSIT
jgi:GTP cyclohydrolase IA